MRNKFQPILANSGAALIWGSLILCVFAAGLLVNKPGSSPEVQHNLTMTAFGIVGFGVGLLLLARTVWEGAGFTPNRVTEFLPGVLVAVLFFWFSYSFGMRQVGGFDQSILVDAGWRMLQGQRPYVDFPCTLPLGFCLGATLAYHCFGVSWSALMLFNAFVCAGAFLWTLLLLNKLYPGQPRLALCLATLIQAMCLLPVCYWWYNPATITVAVIYLLSSANLLLRPESAGSKLSYLVALFLLSTMKPNTAGLLILPVTLILLSGARTARLSAVLSLAALGMFFLLLSALGISFGALMNGYAAAASRGLELGMFFKDAGRLEISLSVAGGAIVILPAAIFVALNKGAKLPLRLFAVGLAGVVASINSFLANGELKLVDLSLMFTGVVVLLSQTGGGKSPGERPSLKVSKPWASYFILIGATLSFIAFGQGFTRHRVKCIGYGAFFEYEFDPTPIRSGFFKNARISRGLEGTLGELSPLLADNKQKVYFGPRMQWGYAAFGFMSPRGQPVWWHPNTSFRAATEGNLIADWSKHRFDLLIFFKHDFTYFSQQFVDVVTSNYTADDHYAHLTVYRLNK